MDLFLILLLIKDVGHAHCWEVSLWLTFGLWADENYQNNQIVDTKFLNLL